MADLIAGTATYVVGVEDAGEAVKVYVKHRSEGLYFLLEREDDKAKARAAWPSAWLLIALANIPYVMQENERGPDQLVRI